MSGKFTSSAIAAKNKLSAQVKKFTQAVTGSDVIANEPDSGPQLKERGTTSQLSNDQPSVNKTVSFSLMDDEEEGGDDHDEGCRNFVKIVTELGNVKVLEQELVSNVSQILSTGSSHEENAGNIHKAAMQFVGTVLKEAWGSFEDHIKWREAKVEARVAEREREAEKKVKQSELARRRSIEMQACSLKELAMLRDQSRTLGEHLLQSCKVETFEPLNYLDDETRSLVVQLVEEKLKSFLADADKEDNDTILGMMIQEKITKAKAPLIEKLSKLQVENFENICSKGALESEVAELKQGKESLAKALEKSNQLLDEARRASRDLQDSKEESELELAIAKEEAERAKLRAEQAEEECKEALEALASAPAVSSTVVTNAALQNEAVGGRVLVHHDEGDEQKKALDCKDIQADRRVDSSDDLTISEKLQAADEVPGCTRSARPILPGASATVQLAHAQQLQAMLEESPERAVDLIAVLSDLGAKVVGEFSEVVAEVDNSAALEHFKRRLDITRRETNSVRRLCAVLLEDLIALHNLLQGRGQPQYKLNTASKRLTLSMQAFRTHLSSSCTVAQFSVEHLEELRRFAASLAANLRKSQQTSTGASERPTKASESDHDDGQTKFRLLRSIVEPRETLSPRPTKGFEDDDDDGQMRFNSLGSIGSESIPGSQNEVMYGSIGSGASSSSPPMRIEKVKSTVTVNSLDSSIGVSSCGSALFSGVPSVKSRTRSKQASSPRATPQYATSKGKSSASSTTSTMMLELEEPAVVLRTPSQKSKDSQTSKGGIIRRPSTSGFGLSQLKKIANPGGKSQPLDQAMPIVASSTNSTINMSVAARRASIG